MQSSRQTADSDDLDRKRRRRLFKDLLVFQIKLLIDAFKDLLLSPMALVAAVVDLLQPKSRPGMLFYRLLRAGHMAEERIDLFGTRRGQVREPETWTVDRALDQLEGRLATRRGTGRGRGESENPGEHK
jgi:hypothetical protein